MENIRQQYKNSKLEIITPTVSDEFEFGSYSVSDIQDCIKYIIKINKTLSTNPSIHIYINRINNRLVFKIKDEYKLEFQTSETMKLFDSTKKKQNKEWRKCTKFSKGWNSFNTMQFSRQSISTKVGGIIYFYIQ